MPVDLVLSVPRVLEVSSTTLDFFETVVCGLTNKHDVQIKAIDVLAFFLLDEQSMGDFAGLGASDSRYFFPPELKS